MLGINLLPVLWAISKIARRPKENKVGTLLLAAVALHVAAYRYSVLLVIGPLCVGWLWEVVSPGVQPCQLPLAAQKSLERLQASVMEFGVPRIPAQKTPMQ